MLKLSKDEIKEILKLPTVNERKSYIQTIILKEWIFQKKGILELFTGFGNMEYFSYLYIYESRYKKYN